MLKARKQSGHAGRGRRFDAGQAPAKIAITLRLDADRVRRLEAIAEARIRADCHIARGHGRPHNVPALARRHAAAAGRAAVRYSGGARLNQSRAFLLRLDVMAELPLTRDWFPDIEHPNRGIVAIAPAALQAELVRLATNLMRRRRELLDMRGP